MRKVVPIKYLFKYVETDDSEKRVKIAYSRIFEIARKNIVKKRKEKRSVLINKDQ